MKQLDGWRSEALAQRLPEGWRVSLWDAVASTQDVARAAARAGAPAGSVFVADYQSAGRGRQGRTWMAPPSTALLLSTLLLIREGDRPQRAALAGAIALADAIERVAPRLAPQVKWPNDVLLDGQKVAGILAEGSWLGARALLVLGVGVNVHTTAAQLAEVAGRATGLDLASGRVIDRGDLLVALLDRLNVWWRAPWEAVRTAWEQRLCGMGQVVQLREPSLAQSAVQAVVLGVDEDGALRLRLPDGRQIRSLVAEILT